MILRRDRRDTCHGFHVRETGCLSEGRRYCRPTDHSEEAQDNDKSRAFFMQSPAVPNTCSGSCDAFHKRLTRLPSRLRHAAVGPAGDVRPFFGGAWVLCRPVSRSTVTSALSPRRRARSCLRPPSCTSRPFPFRPFHD